MFRHTCRGVGNRLYRNDDGSIHRRYSPGPGWRTAAGVGVAVSWTSTNDGDLDIYHTNGWQDWDEFGGFNTDTSKAFVSNGDGTFTGERGGTRTGRRGEQGARHSLRRFLTTTATPDILQLHMHAENAATLWMNAKPPTTG